MPRGCSMYYIGYTVQKRSPNAIVYLDHSWSVNLICLASGNTFPWDNVSRYTPCWRVLSEIFIHAGNLRKYTCTVCLQIDAVKRMFPWENGSIQTLESNLRGVSCSRHPASTVATGDCPDSNLHQKKISCCLRSRFLGGSNLSAGLPSKPLSVSHT